MAKTIKISATRISSFLECKFKYWCNYVEHRPKVPSPAFRLGIAVHESLELAGAIWMKKGKFTAADKKKVIDKYVEVSIKEGIEDMSVHTIGKELVQKRIGSFDLGKILGLELQFGFRGGEDITTKHGVPLMGAIDKVVEIDEETLLIVDYKTSKTSPTSDQMKTDNQLSIYDLVANYKWPGYKRIILSLDLLKHDMLYTYRTPEERAAFEEYLKEVYDQMTSFTEKDAKPLLNMFCPWCDYKEYCATYEKACKKSNYKFQSAIKLPQEELVQEWQDVKNIKKILEERDRELGMILIEKIKRDNENPTWGDKEVYIRQSARTEYDLDVISKVVPPDRLIKMVNLNKRAVETYANDNPAARDLIHGAARINFTRPFLATKKLRKVKEKKDGKKK
jgi:putative RecB family exonuclease